MTSNTITLDADPFAAGGGFPASGVYVHYPSYDNADSDQQEWLYNADTTYKIGTNADDGYLWGI